VKIEGQRGESFLNNRAENLTFSCFRLSFCHGSFVLNVSRYSYAKLLVPQAK
jgi:hypothetical protein